MGNDLALLAEVEATGALTELGLVLPRDITPARYEAMGVLFGRADGMLKWAVGDWLFQGEAIWGEEVYQLQESLGLSVGQRLQYVRVSGDVPISRRRVELTWSHHRSVAPLPPEEQELWLQRAIDERWTKVELEAALKEARGEVEKPRRPYVVEQVCDAAEHIWDAAQEAGRKEPIPVWLDGPLQELADALGVVE